MLRKPLHHVTRVYHISRLKAALIGRSKVLTSTLAAKRARRASTSLQMHLIVKHEYKHGGVHLYQLNS